MTIDELLAANGIALDSTAPGEDYAICPQCSHDRKKKTIKCLGVKIDAQGVCWVCHHCGWSGPQKGTGTGTAEYSAVDNYVDADGNLLWQKLRSKNPRPNQNKFMQRKPDGHGGWIYKKVREGLRSVLYRLPQVIATIKAGKTITIVEGEKDVNNLWSLGIPATCSPDGAANPGQRPKWKKEHSEQLLGADAVVMGDHDDPGYKHQDVTARTLVGIAQRVRVLKLAEHWPECPEGGDVSDWLAAGHTADELLTLLANAPDYHSEDPPGPGSPADGGHHEGKPIIYRVKGEIARTIDESEEALIAADVPILVRARMLVQPIVDTVPAAHKRKTQVTLLRPLSTENVIYLLNKHAAAFVAYNERKKDWVLIDPPEAVAKGLVQKGHWKFPKVTGIITIPTLRPDGTILDKPGYDPITQLWYAPATELVLPTIKEHPTKEDAEQALALLETLLKNFPFVAPVDLSVALAAILTALLRGAFDVAPMFLFRAHQASSGKSYLADLISTMARGQVCPVITNAKSMEEMEKRLGAFILEGVPMISIDNCTSNLRGDMLCQVTERQLIRIRILGKSQLAECEWRGVLFATGNNITYEGDMTRRGLQANLDAQVEQPELRKFSFNPIEQVLNNRGAYIAAALTIARAFLAAGSPDKCEPLASYGEWTTAARAPLIWLGKEDPVKSMETTRDEDPVRSAARTLITLWQQHFSVGIGYTASEIIKTATERTMSSGVITDEPTLANPELHELLMQQAGTPAGNRISPTTLGNWLMSIRGQIHYGYRIMLVRESSAHGNKYALQAVTPAAK
jgi:hypothetical protein